MTERLSVSLYNHTPQQTHTGPTVLHLVIKHTFVKVMSPGMKVIIFKKWMTAKDKDFGVIQN